MKYLLIIAHDDAFRPASTLVSEIQAWISETMQRGIRVHGNPLQPADTGVTVRVRGGRRMQTSGPFSQSKEQLCAYELIDCKDMEAALDAAASHPMAAAASIEVRPVWNELVGMD